MNIKFYFIFLYLVFFSLFGSKAYCFVDQDQILPRSYGYVKLGMSAAEFKKKTGVGPAPSVICADGELEADLYCDPDLAKRFQTIPIVMKDAYLKYQSSNLQPEQVTCFFYKGVLYAIVMTAIKDKIRFVRDRYEKALGKPTAHEVWDTGVANFRWEKSSTLLKVVFVSRNKKKNDCDYIEITYADLRIMKQLHEEMKRKFLKK